jgi:hypothetical protein
LYWRHSKFYRLLGLLCSDLLHVRYGSGAAEIDT